MKMKIGCLTEKETWRVEWLKKNKNRYTCKSCRFSTPHKSNYNLHLTLPKHIRNVKIDNETK